MSLLKRALQRRKARVAVHLLPEQWEIIAAEVLKTATRLRAEVEHGPDRVGALIDLQAMSGALRSLHWALYHQPVPKIARLEKSGAK